MATLARSTAWPAAELWYVAVANRIVAGLMRAERRGLLLYPVLLAVMGALASCAPEPAPTPKTATFRLPPPPAETVSPARPVPRPSRKPTPPGEGPVAAAVGQPLVLTPAKPSAETAGPEAPSPQDLTPASISPGPAGPPPPEAGELIGIDQPAATRLFGPAAERSEQPPATVWRYKSPTCELDLFFYLDLSSGQMRTLHYAFKGDGAAVASRRQDCLRSLVASRGG